MNTYKYDTEELLDATDLLSLCDEVGIDYRKKGKYTEVLCPFHNDNNYGSAILIDGYIKGRYRKGIHCFACGRTFSVMDIVSHYTGEENMGLGFIKNLDWLADFNGGEDLYVQQEYLEEQREFQQSRNEYTNTESLAKNKPVKAKFPLSAEDLILLGLKEYSTSDTMPAYFVNLNVSDYLSNVDAKNKEALLICDFFKGHFHCTEYVKYSFSAKEKYNIKTLWQEDEAAFIWMIKNKCESKLKDVESILELSKYGVTEDFILLRYGLKKIKRKLNDILDKVIACEVELSEAR